jgi:hypothetical protein
LAIGYCLLQSNIRANYYLFDLYSFSLKQDCPERPTGH